MLVRKADRYCAQWEGHWHRISYVDERDLLIALRPENSGSDREAVTVCAEGSPSNAVREVEMDVAVLLRDGEYKWLESEGEHTCWPETEEYVDQDVMVQDWKDDLDDGMYYLEDDLDCWEDEVEYCDGWN